MRTGFALGLAVAISASLGTGTALAGKTLIEKEFVGAIENRNKTGNGKDVDPGAAATSTAARAAGSNNTIAEGSPPGRSDSAACDPSAANAASNPACKADYAGDPVVRIGNYDKDDCAEEDTATDALRPDNCVPGSDPDVYATGTVIQEAFKTFGTLPVVNAKSVNGFPVSQNIPTCPDAGQTGLPADYQWTMGIQRPPVSDIQIQICLDVRKCQEEQDPLGQAATVPIRDFEDSFGEENPVLIRVVHHRGNLQVPGETAGPSNCPCEDRSLVDIANPTLRPIRHALFPEEVLPATPDGALPRDVTTDEILDESIAFVGKDCIVKTVRNDGFIAAHDFITVQLKVPGTTRVRVRASQDAASLCYIGTPLPGEQL